MTTATVHEIKKQLEYELMKDREGEIKVMIVKTGLTKKQDVGGQLHFTKDMREIMGIEFLLNQIRSLLKEVIET